MSKKLGLEISRPQAEPGGAQARQALSLEKLDGDPFRGDLKPTQRKTWNKNHVQRMLPTQSLQPIHSSAKLEPAAASEEQLSSGNPCASEQVLVRAAQGFS